MNFKYYRFLHGKEESEQDAETMVLYSKEKINSGGYSWEQKKKGVKGAVWWEVIIDRRHYLFLYMDAEKDTYNSV